MGVGKIYYWFWHDHLQRLEPFTYQFRRMAKNNKVGFWISIAATAGGLTWLLLHIFEMGGL